MPHQAVRLYRILVSVGWFEKLIVFSFGDFLGLPHQDSCNVLIALTGRTLAVLNAIGGHTRWVTVDQELENLWMIFTVSAGLFSLSVLLRPDSSKADLLLTTGVMPIFMPALRLALAYLETSRPGKEATKHGTHVLFFGTCIVIVVSALARVLMHPEERWALVVLLELFIPWLLCFVVVETLRRRLNATQGQLLDEIQRTEQAISDLNAMNQELCCTQSAMASIISAHCDTLVQVDCDLRICDPTPQLVDLLATHGSVDELVGRPITDFVVSESAVKILEAIRQHESGTESDTSSHSGAIGSTSSSTYRTTASSVGPRRPASVFKAELLQADGTHIFAEVYHARVSRGSSKELNRLGRQGNHVLGLRLESSTAKALPAVERAGRDPSKVIEEGTLEDDLGLNIGSTAAVLPSGDCDPSRIAVKFDAGSDDFTLIGGHSLFAASPRTRKRPDLLRCIRPDLRKAFEKWVVSEVHSSPWGEVVVSADFPCSLALKFPCLPHFKAVANRVWLEILPPVDDGTLPTILWLHGLAFRSPPMAPKLGERHHTRPSATLAHVEEGVTEESQESQEETSSVSNSDSSGSSWAMSQEPFAMEASSLRQRLPVQPSLGNE